MEEWRAKSLRRSRSLERFGASGVTRQNLLTDLTVIGSPERSPLRIKPSMSRNSNNELRKNSRFLSVNASYVAVTGFSLTPRFGERSDMIGNAEI